MYKEQFYDIFRSILREGIEPSYATSVTLQQDLSS
jgi:hypothetical protein